MQPKVGNGARPAAAIPCERGNAGTAEPGTLCCEPDIDGDASIGGMVGQAEFRIRGASGTPGVTDQLPMPLLYDHRIGDGEVVKERIVGPLAGLVGWRSEAGRCAGETQMGEDSPDDHQALDEGEDFHRVPAARSRP